MAVNTLKQSEWIPWFRRKEWNLTRKP